MRKHLGTRNIIAPFLILAFLINSFGLLPLVQAQDFRLPAPGVMVHLSPEFDPPILKGIKVHPDNPFRFDFILDTGNVETPLMASLRSESTKLIKYFLASLTIPEKDMWVNLSPYEKDRIIPNSFGLTEMGRDLLAEDYMLKQITASLIYPEDGTGKRFWKRVYEEAADRYGTTNIPVNTFNKVWIIPEKAVVYENAKVGTAYVVEAKLKVMLEQDYLALEKNYKDLSSPNALVGDPGHEVSTSGFPIKAFGNDKDVNALGSQIIREIVIPELTKEVNENKNFTQLRQIYNSLILATWYKKKIKDSILSQVYLNKNKVSGVNIDDPREKDKIYQRYLKAFKKGVYNYIKEDTDPITQQIIPRKYFSGGVAFNTAMTVKLRTVQNFDRAQLIDPRRLMDVAIRLRDVTRSILPGRAANINKDTRLGDPLFEEVGSVVEAMSNLENIYIRHLQEARQATGPLELIALKQSLEEDHGRLMARINGFRNAWASKGTPAFKAFDRYAKQLEKTRDVVLDILSVYTDRHWPQSRKGDESFNLNHARARDVWENWETEKNPEKRGLTILKDQYDEHYRQGTEELSVLDARIEEGLRKILNEELSASAQVLNGSFRVICFSEAVFEAGNGRLTLDEIEKFFHGFLFTDEELMEYERQGNPFFPAKGSELFKSVASGMVNFDQWKKIQSIIGQELGKTFRRVKIISSFKRKFILGTGLAVLAGMAPGQYHVSHAVDYDAKNKTTLTRQSTNVQPSSQPASVKELIDSMGFSRAVMPVASQTGQGAAGEHQKEQERLKKLQQQMESQEAQIELNISANNQRAKEIDQKLNDALKPLQEVGDKKSELKPSQPRPPVPDFWYPVNAVKQGLTSPEGTSKFVGPAFGADNVTQGIPNQQNLLNTPIAHVQGDNLGYLSTGSYSAFDPITGKLFPQTSNMKPWHLTGEATQSFIDLPSGVGRSFIAPVPPGYKIVGIHTTQQGISAQAFYDANNQSWGVSLGRVSGPVRLGVKPASGGELGTAGPLRIVDANGHPVSSEEFRAQMKKDMPGELWDFFELNKDRPIEERRQMREQLIKGLKLYYSTNPKLSSGFTSSNSLQKSLYLYMAGKCDGLTAMHAVISMMLNLDDVVIKNGYMVQGPDISAADYHLWSQIEGRTFESTQLATLSPFYLKVTNDLENEQELKFLLHVWAPASRDELKILLVKIKNEMAKNRLVQEIVKIRGQQANKPEYTNSPEEFQKIQDYYSELTDDYRHQLEALQNGPMDAQAADELKAFLYRDIPADAFSDPYQYMAASHFMNALAALLVEKGFGDRILRTEVYERMGNFGLAKGWDPQKLREPFFLSGKSPIFRPGLVTIPASKIIDNRLIIRDIDGHRYIIDILTNEKTEIPDGYTLRESITDGLYVVEGPGPVQNLVGKKAGKFAGPLSGFIVNSGILGDDWYIETEGNREDILMGPLIEQELGTPSMTPGVNFSNLEPINIIQGKAIISYVDGSGAVRYGGRLAREMGIDQMAFLNGRKPFELTDGRIVVVAKGKDRRWRFYGNGVPDSLKAQSFVDALVTPHIFSKGRWAYAVKYDGNQWGYAGDLQDEDILKLRLGASLSSTGTSTHLFALEHNLYGDFFEAPDGSIGFVMAGGHVRGQWFQEHLNQIQIAKEENIYVSHAPVFFDKDGKIWVMRVGPTDISTPAGLRWVGSQDIISMYLLNDPVAGSPIFIRQPSFFGDGNWITWISYAEDLSRLIGPTFVGTPIGKIDQGRIFENGQWFIVFHRFVEMKQGPNGIPTETTVSSKSELIGSWADSHGLSGFSANGTFDVHFAYKKNGKEDPDNYMLVRPAIGGGSIAEGPLADAMGITGQRFYGSSNFDASKDGNSAYIELSTAGPLERYYWRRGYTFEQRMDSLWRLGYIDAFEHVPAEPDLLWRNFDQLVTANSSELDKELDDIERMEKNGSSRRDILNSGVLDKAGELMTAGKALRAALLALDQGNHHFDAHQVEKIIRNHKKFLARALYYFDLYPLGWTAMEDMFYGWQNGLKTYHTSGSIGWFEHNFLSDQGLGHIVLEIVGEIYRYETVVLGHEYKKVTGGVLVDNLDDFVRETYGSSGRMIDDFEYARQKDLPPAVAGVFLSPLRFEQTDDIRRVNDIIKSTLSSSERQSIEAYESDSNQSAVFLEAMAARNSGPSFTRKKDADMIPVLAFLHQRVGNNFPFDVEMSNSKDPTYALARLVMGNVAFFKTGLHVDVRDQYREWHRINDELNKLSKGVPMPQAGFSVGQFIQTVSSDTLALAFLVGILLFCLGPANDRLRHKDRLAIGKSAQEVFEQMWAENPWFDGEGYGNAFGAKELTRRILFEGLSEREREELRRMRPKLDPKQNAVIDAILALAVDSPADSVTSAWQRLFYLAPFIGVTLAARSPLAFRKRQAMNGEIVKAMREPAPSAQEYLRRIWNIVAKYSQDSPSIQEPQVLDFPSLLLMDPEKDGSRKHRPMAPSFYNPKEQERWEAQQQTRPDGAMKTNTGGIDLTSDKVNSAFAVKMDSQLRSGIQFHLDSAMLRQLQNAPGFTIGSISIQPLKSLFGFLGLKEDITVKSLPGRG